MSQQAQPDKNFGVVTINASSNPGSIPESDLEDAAELNFVEQVISHSTKFESTAIESPLPSNFNSQQCFLCLACFKDEKELTDHMAQHLELSSHPQLNLKTSKLEVLSPDDLEASLLVKTESSIDFHLDHDTCLDDLDQPVNLEQTADALLRPALLTTATTTTTVNSNSAIAAVPIR
jgi:hypothetical protein